MNTSAWGTEDYLDDEEGTEKSEASLPKSKVEC